MKINNNYLKILKIVALSILGLSVIVIRWTGVYRENIIYFAIAFIVLIIFSIDSFKKDKEDKND